MDSEIYYEKQSYERVLLKDCTVKQGTIKGYKYRILGLGSHPTAYVRVPKTHKYYSKGYDDIPVSVHGGLTFSETTRGCHWIGWDYAHLGDALYYPQMNKKSPNLFKNTGDHFWTVEEIMIHVQEVIFQLEKEDGV